MPTSRAPPRRKSRRYSLLCARSGAAGAIDPRLGEKSTSRHPRTRLSRGAAAQSRRDGGEVDRLRLPRRPARCDDASVLQRHRSRRLPHHHALQSASLQRSVLRHPARGGARHLRTGSADPMHYGTPLGSACFARHPRIAIATVGEPGRPRSALLGAFLPAGEEGVPGGAAAMSRSTSGCLQSTTCGRRSSAWRPTRRPTTCTSSCASSWNRR